VVLVDIISVLLFLLTLGLIFGMLTLNLAKYKFHFLFAVMVLGVAIYTYGMSFNGEALNSFDLVLKAFGNTTQILRGIFRTSEISFKINNDVLFLLTAYAIHVIGFGYTYILIFAIFFNHLGLRMRFYFHKQKPHYLILADDEKLQYLLQAYEKEHRKKSLPNRLKAKPFNVAVPKALMQTKELKTKYLFKPGFATFDIQYQSIDHLFKARQHEGVLISLMTKDEDVLSLVEQLNRYYQDHPETKLITYIMYANKQHLPMYESFTQQKQRIQFFSYHQLIAQQLVLEYPLTTLIPSRFLNSEKATLVDVTIKYHLFGFGETNQEIYQHLFVTNQLPPSISSFFGKEIKHYENHPVQYHIYRDRHHPYLPLPEIITSSSNKDYLPLPPLSATTKWSLTSFDQPDYLQIFSDAVTPKDDMHLLVIAFDHDVTNLRVLQQTLDWINQKRLTDYKVFVQITNRDYIRSSHLFKQPHVIPFGFGDYAFSLHQIMNPVFSKIAAHIQATLNPLVPFHELLWQDKETLLYEAISLRFKLNLIGLDLAVGTRGITEEKFFKRYDAFEESRFHQSHPRAKNDADLNRYKPVAKKKRNLLARQEHLRWSAYKIVRGYSPMSFTDMIKLKAHQDDMTKKDGRLTSFEGLFDLHHYLHTKLNYPFADADFIYPFFHTLDHLFTILKGTPYQVVDTVDESHNQTIELTIEEETHINSSIKS
jgi:hypothetical protein